MNYILFQASRASQLAAFGFAAIALRSVLAVTLARVYGEASVGHLRCPCPTSIRATAHVAGAVFGMIFAQYWLTCPECGHQMEVGKQWAAPCKILRQVRFAFYSYERGTGRRGKCPNS